MKALLCIFLLWCSSIHALVLSKDSVTQALAAAEWVGEIRVVDRQAIQDETGIVTRNTAQVERTLFGNPETEIEFYTLGGELGAVGSFYSGMPRAYRNKRYRVYLKHQKDQWWITGWESGLVPLEPTRAFTRNRTDGSDGDGDGSFLYWKENYFPIPYFIAQDTFTDSGMFVREIDRSFFTWRQTTGVVVDFIPMGCINNGKNLNDGHNTILMIRDHWPFDASAIAITRNFYIAGDTPDSGLILDSDILLNAQDHAFATSGEATSHDVRNIVTHEVGHFLGLGHEITPEDTTATMYAQASTGETMKRTLEANDINGVQQAYAGVATKPAQWIERFPSCAPRDGGACLLVKGSRPPNALSLLVLGLIWFLGWKVAQFTA